MTTYETMYQKFYDLIEKDDTFFNYNGVSTSDALELANTRAKNYLNEALSIFQLKCQLDIEIEVDDDNEVITTSLTNTEILIIAMIMYTLYLSRDIVLLKSVMNTYTSSEVKMLFSPSNERRTFMDMYKYVDDKVDTMIDKYNSVDRITGKRKVIDYGSFSV